MNNATLVIVTNPFRPLDGRVVRQIPRRRRIAALAPCTALPVICLVNGAPVLRARWKGTRVKRGDIVTFVTLPQGGGGGGSDPLKTVLMIALMVVAPEIAGMAALSATGTTLLTIGINMVGNALINAILPPPKPPAPHQAAALSSPSPTYNVNAQGNVARLGQAIPVLYGRHIIFLDYGATPYAEYIANEQYSYLLFCLGQGEMQLEQVRFDKSDISAYGGDVVYEVIPPGGAVTLFPVNVVTSSEVAGQEMPGRKDVTYSQSGTTVTITETAHGRTAGNWVSFDFTTGTAVDGDFAIASIVDANTWTVTASGSLTTSGNVKVYSYLGGTGFVANVAGTLANQICIDVALPQGLGILNVGGGIDPATVSFYVEAQPIDGSGNATGAYFYLTWFDPAHRASVAVTQAKATKALTYVLYAGYKWVTTPSVQAKITLAHAGTANHTVKRAGVTITGWTLSAGTGAGGVDEILIPSASQKNLSLTATVAWSVTYTYAATLLEQSITAATNTPQRRSYLYQIAPGRYRVRVARSDIKNTAAGSFHTLAWIALEAYLPGAQNYGNVTMMAMRIRASAMTQNAAQKVNVIATRCLPVWDTVTGWSSTNVPTQSIAWAMADAAKNTEYGGRQIDAQINLAQLDALDTVWTTRGDTFNGIFDNSVSLWEALTSIARAGRAKPFLQGGVLQVVRSQAQQTPVALFSMRNIARGSFSVDYAFPNAATTDSVEMTYFDEDVWQQRTVMCTLPGGTANNPAKVTAFGMTNRDHAHREGIYIAACNKYQRKMPKFRTEMSGFIPCFGDQVAVQHDMPSWGQHAEVVDYDSGNSELVLSEPFEWTPGQAHYLGFRKRDGSLTAAVQVAQGNAVDRVKLLEALPIALDTDSTRERTHVSFGPGDAWRQQVIVTHVTPRSLTSVELTCVNENPIVHTVENDVATPPWVGW